MAATELNALIDSDVLLDFLDGHAPAREIPAIVRMLRQRNSRR
jgi:hypothetical protein